MKCENKKNREGIKKYQDNKLPNYISTLNKHSTLHLQTLVVCTM